jgi:hypothetical protein
MAEGLFTSFKPKWWDAVSVRASARTFVGLQTDVQPILFGIVLFVLSTLLTYVSMGLAAAATSAKASILNGLAWTFLFFC